VAVRLSQVEAVVVQDGLAAARCVAAGGSGGPPEATTTLKSGNFLARAIDSSTVAWAKSTM